MTAGPLAAPDDAATPLTPEERDGLLPSYITLRRELNEAEQAGVLETERWAFARRRQMLDERFLKNLHKRMFGSVWRWAGTYRSSARNIGVEAWRIGPTVVELLADTSYWIENATYGADEIGARFHHRLVLIHPFPNGNGRHARLAADLLLVRLGRPRFTWGASTWRHLATHDAPISPRFAPQMAMTTIRSSPSFAVRFRAASRRRITQAQALSMRCAGAWGIAYDSVRLQGGECAGLFRPRALTNCRPERHLAYAWDGTRIAGGV